MKFMEIYESYDQGFYKKLKDFDIGVEKASFIEKQLSEYKKQKEEWLSDQPDCFEKRPYPNSIESMTTFGNFIEYLINNKFIEVCEVESYDFCDL